MIEPLVVAFIGPEDEGLNLVSRLDQRIQRPVRLVTTQRGRLKSVLEGKRIDCLVCGSLPDGELQRVIFDVVDTRDEIPLFDASGDVAAVPTHIELHQLDPEAGPRQLAEQVLTTILDCSGQRGAELSRGPFSYLAVDTDWNIVDWDPELSEWTEWDPNAAVGTSLWDVFPGWVDAEFEGACREAMDWDEKTRVRVFHGPSRKWVEFHIVGTRGDGIELFALDVTEFQNAGGNIEGTSARFEETLDRITDAFFALDNEERFVFLNTQAEFLLDVDAQDVTSVRFWDAFPAAVSTTFYREFNRAMETQEPTSFEEYYTPLDSWFEVNAYPSSDGLSVFLRDITEQVELQRKLEQLHDVTRGLVVAESDQEIAERTVEATEGVLDFPMVTVWKRDEMTETLNPLAWSETIDERVEKMCPLGRDSEFIWEVYETGEPRVLGFVPATTMTSHHPGKVTSELLVRVGEYGVLGAYSDERDAFDETDVELFKILSSTVESAFRRAKRERQLARRNERLDDFASIVSHDLRNPLTVASSHTELARMKDGPVEHLDRIQESLHRMEDLIEDLLSRARGDGELAREVLLLAETARDAWDNVDTGTTTLHLDGDANFNADPDRLQQLFENLFRNAVEHNSTSNRPPVDDAIEHGLMSPGSQTRQDAVEQSSTSNRPPVDDATERRSSESPEPSSTDRLGQRFTADSNTVSNDERDNSTDSSAGETEQPVPHSQDENTAEKEAGAVTVRVGTVENGFYVEDDGVGIPESLGEDIFEQGVSHTDEGTGYGLAIVVDIVEGHGWDITVTESESGGARFEIVNIHSLTPLTDTA